MTIPATELGAIVRQMKAGALPNEASRLEIVFDHIERANVTARLDSPESAWLREIVEAHRSLIEPGVFDLLTETDCYGVDLDIINACPRSRRNRRQVILFSGLLRIIRCYAELITVLNLLHTHRPDMMFHDRPETLAMSMGGFSIMADYLIAGHAPVTFGDILGPRALANVENGCAGAALFILAHEVGHLHLGHLSGGRERGERPPLVLMLPEEIDEYQREEFEADEFAYFAFTNEIREKLMPSVLFFLGPQSFFEAFARPGKSHPFAVNRAAQMAKLMSQGSDAARAVAGIVETQAQGFQNLAQRRADNGGDIRFKIHESMPPHLAHTFVLAIKARVLLETGLLEAVQ